jgi:hypothetical protein
MKMAKDLTEFSNTGRTAESNIAHVPSRPYLNRNESSWKHLPEGRTEVDGFRNAVKFESQNLLRNIVS